MRIVGAALMCFVFVLGTGCVDEGEEDVATAEQAVQVGPQGQLDVPLPDSDPMPPNADGPPLPVQAVPADVIAKQDAYLTAVNARLAGWQAAGKSQQEIESLQAALKREYFEE